MARLVLLMIAIMMLTALGAKIVHAKSGSVLITEELRQNAVRNCERFEWAAEYRDALIAQLQPWMERSDEELWRLVPSQEMPRDAAVNRGDGCPNCGQEHYNAPYNPSRWRTVVPDRPWQVQCRNCDQWFPSNDFAAYYDSALDEQGKFRQGAGDPRFLAPLEGGNPDWVDDGTGVEVGGKKWFFAAFYAFNLWQQLLDVTEKMAVVYTLTGDTAYAHRAAVLLDRMADVYPEMDYHPHYRLGMECSTGGSGRGRVQGKIWETWTAEKCSLAYDHIYDALIEDEELVEFSARMAGQYATGDKSSPEAIARHIEDNLLREFILGVKDTRIQGNPGMHHHAMVCAAIALDDPEDSEAALDWLFAPDGGEIPYIMHERLAREGLSDESALGYSSIPARSFYQVVGLLHRYPSYTKHDILRDYPKFRASYTLGAAVRMMDTFSPNWGDGDKCMNWSTTGTTIPVEMALQGYEIFGGEAIAREVWFANRKTLDGLFAARPGGPRQAEGIRWQIYAEDPEAILEDLRRDIGDDPGPLRSYNSGGHGMAVLQAPWRGEQGRALSMYYGRMYGHGHYDRLNYLLAVDDIVMVPDMGYPLYTGQWPKRFGWVNHIISHNTCMVNDTNPSSESFSGRTRLFADAGPLRAVDVDGGEIYEGVTTYRRCMTMVDVDETHSYVLDVFWVRGGTNHRLIQNGGGPTVSTEGLELTEQPTGTLAGPEVAYGEPYDGELNSRYAGTGFSFLENVSKAGPSEEFVVDWRIVDQRRERPEDWERHLRAHNLTPVDEVVLADGIPPLYAGNPERLRYLLRSRLGEGRESQFVTVIEPFGVEGFIESVRMLDVQTDAPGFVAAVEVTLVDGRRDVLIVTEEEAQVAAGGVLMEGRIGLARFDAGEVVTRALLQGERLEAGGEALELPAAALRGTLAGWDDSDPARVLLRLDGVELSEEVVGRYVIFDSAERSDASYLIEEVVDASTVRIGAPSLVERLVDRGDYDAGVTYTIAPGDAFVIALSAAG
ncbi:MAG: heparinase II/III domain-containing protein [Armatimonadota bacterium]|jgi:hypothetical protein